MQVKDVKTKIEAKDGEKYPADSTKLVFKGKVWALSLAGTVKLFYCHSVLLSQ